MQFAFLVLGRTGGFWSSTAAPVLLPVPVVSGGPHLRDCRVCVLVLSSVAPARWGLGSPGASTARRVHCNSHLRSLLIF